MDGAGNLYIADNGNAVIRMDDVLEFKSLGPAVILTDMGGPPASENNATIRADG